MTAPASDTAPARPGLSKIERVLLLREVMNSMTRFGSPPPMSLPTGPGILDADTVSLAQDSANSAVAIAKAAAELGMGATADGDSSADQTRAETIWTETLAQMARIQKLYKLDPLPFQPGYKKEETPAPVP